jgi:hypothetical protein
VKRCVDDIARGVCQWWSTAWKAKGVCERCGNIKMAPMYPNSFILSPPQPYLALRSTLCSCKAYGTRCKCKPTRTALHGDMEVHPVPWSDQRVQTGVNDAVATVSEQMDGAVGDDKVPTEVQLNHLQARCKQTHAQGQENTVCVSLLGKG